MKMSLELISHFIENFLTLNYFKNKPLKPLLLAYFVTFRCDLKCHYCEYAIDHHYKNYPELKTEPALQLLRLARRGVPAIAFSGGEPLLRDDIVVLVKEAKALGFKPISLFTNGLKLPDKEEILDYLDFLQISLDTIDEAKQDAIFGTSGIVEIIKENIIHYARQQTRRNFRINLNAVISPNTIKDIFELYSFARSIGLRLTVCPQLNYGKPLSSLINNFQYQSLINQLISLKKHDDTIMDTDSFLDHIYSFKPYRCYPYLTPRIYPDGALVGPCPIIEATKVNLLEIGSWKSAYKQLIEECGERFVCKDPCFLPCYLETSTLMMQPWKSLRELIRLGNPKTEPKRPRTAPPTGNRRQLKD
jgi:MoaA/NifB/PqqE/SkfB family radical SAM enzyme